MLVLCSDRQKLGPTINRSDDDFLTSRVGPYTNDKMVTGQPLPSRWIDGRAQLLCVCTENKHYITLFIALSPPGQPEPQLLEPHKCEGW